MQGFNMGRYRPPTPPSPTRPSRPKGPPTIRFELPFSTWCSHCPLPTLIPQGTRFNAVKTRVGSYHSTPIWSFSMKHSLCSGRLVIQTDPQNTQYVVTEGGRAQEKGQMKWGDDQTGLIYEDGTPYTVSAPDDTTGSNDAFACLERTIAHRPPASSTPSVSAIRLQNLATDRTTHWSDPGGKNAQLRGIFRAERKALEAEAAASAKISDRFALEVDVLPETREDALKASIVAFGKDEKMESLEKRALGKNMFNVDQKIPEKKDVKGRTRKELQIQAQKEAFVQEVLGNTRLSTDPFLTGKKPQDPKSSQTSILSSLKRKREPPLDPSKSPPQPPTKNFSNL